MKNSQPQSATAVFMVRPTSFGFDEQTAKSNSFQQRLNIGQKEIKQRANAEFNSYVKTLTKEGIKVVVFEDHRPESKPNAVFPNNWLSMWPDGTVYLYPMATESRRVERSEAALDGIETHFEIGQVVDVSRTENSGRFLESTGVLVFDHKHRIVYGCISSRCDEQLFTKHAQKLGYAPVAFHAYDQNGTAIYHTNVLMGVQSHTAVICLDSIHPKERQTITDSLTQTGHEIIDISFDQMTQFCGNVLELQNKRGKKFLVMSQSAYNAFTPEQRLVLSTDKSLMPVAIPTIEAVGGGSARCMIAEVFLPKLQPALRPIRQLPSFTRT